MARRPSFTAIALAAAATLCGGTAAAQAPTPGVPAAAPPPPAPPPPPVAGAATAVQGLTPTYVEKPDLKAPRKPTGWDPRIALGATVSFANNSNIAGQVSGSSFSFGAKLDAGADYNNGNHEWRSTLGVAGGVTRTPIITELVKTNDALAIESIYLYHVVDWFGPFVRVQMQTSMFPGADVRAGRAKYQYVNPDGTKDPNIIAAPGTDCTPAADGALPTSCHTSYPLSDAFRPLTFKESIGLFVQPYQSNPFTFELRGGVGAQETIAKGQIAVNDDTTTADVLEIQRLSNSNQVGGELSTSLFGSFADKRVRYKVDADFMTPFAHSALPPTETRNAFQLTNIQVDATASFKLIEWASIDYQLRVLRQPAVLDVVQVQNVLLLTFGFSYPVKPPPPACVPVPAPAPAPAKPAAPAAPAPPPPAN